MYTIINKVYDSINYYQNALNALINYKTYYNRDYISEYSINLDYGNSASSGGGALATEGYLKYYRLIQDFN